MQWRVCATWLEFLKPPSVCNHGWHVAATSIAQFFPGGRRAAFFAVGGARKENSWWTCIPYQQKSKLLNGKDALGALLFELLNKWAWEISAVQVQEVSKAAQLSGLEWPQNDVLSSLGMHGENACFWRAIWLGMWFEFVIFVDPKMFSDPNLEFEMDAFFAWLASMVNFRMDWTLLFLVSQSIQSAIPLVLHRDGAQFMEKDSLVTISMSGLFKLATCVKPMWFLMLT